VPVPAGSCRAIPVKLMIDGNLAEIRTRELDLRRTLRVIWDGAANPLAGPARDLVAHIASRTTGGSL
jgi:hypothetical protein